MKRLTGHLGWEERWKGCGEMCESVGAMILRKYRIVVFCGLLVLAVLLSSCAKTKDDPKETNPWSKVRGALSSVVWSPNGDYIAFAAPYGEDYGDDHGNIWIMSAPKPGQPTKLRQLIHLTAKQGIPVALFWLENNRIGWAGSVDARDRNFSFFQMGLQDSKPQPLIDQGFFGAAMRGVAGLQGPDDVYYDAGSRTLLFSAAYNSGGAYVRIIPLATKKVRTLSLPHGVDEASPLTICGSLQDSEKPEFYVAASVVKGSSHESRIWLSHSFSLSQDKVLATSKKETLCFPRLSPNGKMLACLSYETRILVYDLNSGKRRTLATISDRWEGMAPAHGCPFSWSPDGREIAYADGAEVKVVKVARAEE